MGPKKNPKFLGLFFRKVLGTMFGMLWVVALLHIHKYFTIPLLNCAAPLRNADLARDDFLADPKRIAKKLREYICFCIKIGEI